MAVSASGCPRHGRDGRSPDAGKGAALALWIALGALAPAQAAAQSAAPVRDGQWLGVGLGGGLDQVACGVCAGEPKPGIVGHVRFGGTLSRKLLLGGEFDLWTRRDEGTRQFLASLGAVALFYADRDGRFHLKAGAGAVGFRAAEDGDELTALTFGITGGLGYDYPITETLSLTPFASLTLAPFADLKFNGDLAVGDATLGLLQAGLGLTWH